MTTTDQSTPRPRTHTTPQRPQTLDRTTILAWLDSHATGGSPVRQAVYEGLAVRIRRGDFNHQENHA